jgi:KDO2-lipid IV(A) lauroyltransferase
VRKNLVLSLSDKSKKDLIKIEREFYRNLCDYGVETLKLLTISKDELARRITYEDVSEVEAFARQSQSIMLFASHNFNWEWLLAGGSLHLPVSVDFVYQPQNSELFNKFSLATRTRFGGHAIQRKEVAKVSFKRRHLLRGIAIVADQYPGYTRDKKHLVQFLNQETAFFYGAAQLAAAMQYPVMYGEVKKIKRGY